MHGGESPVKRRKCDLSSAASPAPTHSQTRRLVHLSVTHMSSAKSSGGASPTSAGDAKLSVGGGGRLASSAARARDWVEARALFIVAVSAVLILTLAGIPQHLAQDGWLALVAGRLVAAHGVPHYDYFTVMAYGDHWVDQQWLAQFLMYELQRLGGFQLLTVVYVLITTAAFGAAIAVARRLGGEGLHVLAMLPLGAFFYLVTAVSIRTQGLAYPLFIATLYLLATDVRGDRPRRRTWLVLPILILWANIHGSVTVGVGLAVLYGLLQLVKSLRARGDSAQAVLRALAFVAIPPLTLLATPYGSSIVHYYRLTLLNSNFSKLVTEWRPVTSVPILAVPLFVLIAGTAYTLLRTWRRTPAFDALVLVALAVGAVDAVRNVTWFGLAVMVLLPGAVTKLRGDRPAPLRRARVNRLLAITMAALALLTTVVIATRPDRWFTSTYPTRAIPTLQRLVAASPQTKIFADVHYADWLIWEQPRLFSGRVAYDTSLELLSIKQLSTVGSLGRFRGKGTPYRIWVLNPVNKVGNRTLLAQAGVHVKLRTKLVLIVTYVPTSRA